MRREDEMMGFPYGLQEEEGNSFIQTHVTSTTIQTISGKYEHLCHLLNCLILRAVYKTKMDFSEVQYVMVMMLTACER